MKAFTRSSRDRRLTSGQTLSLRELDELLDVEVEQFDKVVTRLVKQFRSKGIRVRVPDSVDQIARQPIDARVTWAGLYELQAQRLAQMDRAEEFVMARRYEFLRARAAEALADFYPEDEIPSLLRGGAGQLPPSTASRSERKRAHLDVAMSEFEALRNHYVEGSLYLVLSCALRYRNLGVDFADLIQEGNASLFQAIEGFDWRRDVRFKTYAQYWIHQAILKVLYNTSRTVRVPIWVQKALGKIKRVRERGRLETGEDPSAEAVGKELDLPADRVRELLRTKRYAVSLDAEVAGDENGASLAQLLPDDRALPIEEVIQDGDLGARLDEAMSDLPQREQLILSRRYGLHGREPETLGEIAADLGITAERVRQLQKVAIGKLRRPGVTRRLRAYANN